MPQARRYYYNIIGKYGAQVQALLKKISALEIKTICPLHGPMLTEDLGEYLRLYDLWSQWKPEEPEGILIAHASIHGNTAHAAKTLKSKLEGKGAQVTMCDLTATDLSYAVASAFYCGKLVLASSTYDGGLFPPMREFLEHLRTKGFRNRRVGLIEDGSWAPAAARLMRTKLEEMKDIHLYETVVSLRGALNQGRKMIGMLGTEEDGKARSALIEHNLRLVVYIAKKFDNTSVGVEDLISIGTIGLIKAINTFKPDKNIKLATYASRCIENEILMYLRRNNKTKLEVSIDEPLNVDWDGNELLLPIF